MIRSYITSENKQWQRATITSSSPINGALHCNLTPSFYGFGYDDNEKGYKVQHKKKIRNRAA